MKTSGRPPVKTITRTASSASSAVMMAPSWTTMAEVRHPLGGLVKVTVAMPSSMLQSTLPMRAPLIHLDGASHVEDELA